MKFIEQKAELIPFVCRDTQEELINDMYKNIEIASRTCYKSEESITEDSAKRMVANLIKDKHFGMLRHGTIYLIFRKSSCNFKFYSETCDFYKRNNFSVATEIISSDDILYVTTSLLVLIDSKRMKDLDYICNPTIFHERKQTIRFTTQLAINREIQTHDGPHGRGRAEESTRFCNYSKNKFSGELTFVYPHWITKETIIEFNTLIHSKEYLDKNADKKDLILNTIKDFKAATFFVQCYTEEQFYLNDIKMGMKPQDARDVLPLTVKTELIYTLFVSHWGYVFNLRTAKNVHPQMKLIMEKAQQLF